MYRPALRGRPPLADKKVLLIDRCQATREARAAVLRSHAVEVHEAEEISGARFLWQPQVYDLVMFGIRRYSRDEALEFYEQITAADPRQRIVFLTGQLVAFRGCPGELSKGEEHTERRRLSAPLIQSKKLRVLRLTYG